MTLHGEQHAWRRGGPGVRYHAGPAIAAPSDATGWAVFDAKVGFEQMGPPDMSKQQAIDAADRLNAEAGPIHEGGRREVEQQG